MKNIAVITGASSGIGKEFALKLNTYSTFDEVWVIARNLSKLEELKDKKIRFVRIARILIPTS